MTSILVVEDDPGIRTALTRGLADRGSRRVTAARRPGRPASRWSSDRPGRRAARPRPARRRRPAGAARCCAAVSAVPVIVVTARDDDATIVRALDAGADDYVVKPFGAEQLDARIRAVLRRGGRPRRADPALARRRAGRSTPRGRDGDAGRAAGGPDPQGVRPAAPAGRPAGRGGHQARAARRGLAAAVRRRRPDRRRPPVLAAPQARRDAPPSRATCTPCAGSASGWSTPSRRAGA